MATTQDLIAAAKTAGNCLNAEEAAAKAHKESVLVLDIREPVEHEAAAVSRGGSYTTWTAGIQNQ